MATKKASKSKPVKKAAVKKKAAKKKAAPKKKAAVVKPPKPKAGDTVILHESHTFTTTHEHRQAWEYGIEIPCEPNE